MLIETKAQCPKCSSPMQVVVSGLERCQQCGFQKGVTYRGSTCPKGCDPALVAVLAHGDHCNSCGADWQR